MGKEWFEYLIGQDIDFFIRIPKSYHIEVNGEPLKAELLLKSRPSCKLDQVTVLGIKGLSVALKKTKDKKGKDDFLIVLTNTFAYLALKNYRQRWSIEAMFQDFKTQGFHLESSHLNEPYKIVKLMYLVSLAYCFCLHAGLHYEKEERKIPKKTHGYRAYSLFRKGLDCLRAIFGKKIPQAMELWHQLINKFIHLARIKLLIINKL